MSRSDEEKDLFLEEALNRLGSPEEGDVQEAFIKFSKIRTRAFSGINGLKDTNNKKLELINIVEELSIAFFQLGIKLGNSGSNQTLEGRLIALENKIDKLNPRQSYAEVSKVDKSQKINVPSGRAVTPVPKKSILFTPLNEDSNLKSSEDTKKALLSKVRPKDLGIQPDRILKCGKAGVRVETKEINENIINQEALKKAGLKYEILGKFKPRLALYGVPSDIDSATVEDELVNNLSAECPRAITVRSRFGPREKPFCHWVIEVSPGVRKELLAKGRIYIGWSACTIKDHIRILRCYKCQKFGHQQTDCKGSMACGHCAGDHDTRKCRVLSGPPRCFNCSRAGLRDCGHEARSTKCNMYAKKLKENISNTDYGQ